MTFSLVLCRTLFSATTVGTILGYSGLVWLVPELIAGEGCCFAATNILAKESDEADALDFPE